MKPSATRGTCMPRFPWRSALMAAFACTAMLSMANARSECTEDDVSVRVVRTQWVDTCKNEPCPVLTGLGEIENRCERAVGIRIRLRALDASGEAVAVGELWPFGRRNVPPGRHEISFDRWIGHDREIVDFQAIVTGVVAWPE